MRYEVARTVATTLLMMTGCGACGAAASGTSPKTPSVHVPRAVPVRANPDATRAAPPKPSKWVGLRSLDLLLKPPAGLSGHAERVLSYDDNPEHDGWGLVWVTDTTTHRHLILLDHRDEGELEVQAVLELPPSTTSRQVAYDGCSWDRSAADDVVAVVHNPSCDEPRRAAAAWRVSTTPPAFTAIDAARVRCRDTTCDDDSREVSTAP